MLVDKDFLEILLKLDRTLSIDCRGYPFITRENNQIKTVVYNEYN